MFCGEVGLSSVEEINHIKKGGNYGWNVLEGDGLQCENCQLGNYIHCAFILKIQAPRNLAKIASVAPSVNK